MFGHRGISQTEETYRYYTGKSDAAPLLGGFSQYSHRGVGGLEQQYDSVLRGCRVCHDPHSRPTKSKPRPVYTQMKWHHRRKMGKISFSP